VLNFLRNFGEKYGYHSEKRCDVKRAELREDIRIIQKDISNKLSELELKVQDVSNRIEKNARNITVNN
jgi:hypothetical protein